MCEKVNKMPKIGKSRLTNVRKTTEEGREHGGKGGHNEKVRFHWEVIMLERCNFILLKLLLMIAPDSEIFS